MATKDNLADKILFYSLFVGVIAIVVSFLGISFWYELKLYSINFLNEIMLILFICSVLAILIYFILSWFVSEKFKAILYYIVNGLWVFVILNLINDSFFEALRTIFNDLSLFGVLFIYAIFFISPLLLFSFVYEFILKRKFPLWFYQLFIVINLILFLLFFLFIHIAFALYP